MIPNPNITRFGLLRHAPTMWNEEKRIQGQQDSPLTVEGKNHAEAWGQRLKMYPWDRILSSDLGRARNTASIINTFLSIPVSHEPRLREREWGRWTGMTLKQVRREDPQLWAAQEKNGWKFCPPTGENLDAVLERSIQALRKAAQDWPNETILVVTHEGVIKSLIYRLCEPEVMSTESPVIRPNHLHWLIHDNGRLKIKELNAISLY
jgi:probable phosphoglycerate mutase